MNMNQTATASGAEPQEGGQPPVSGPGAKLAAQREAYAWTVEQVASQLNLAPRQIQALETDNYAALPGMAIVRGFIRSYAKLLKLEAEPLLAMIPSEAATVSNPAPMRRTLATPFSSDVRLPLTGGREARSKPVLLALAVIVLAGAVLAVYRSGWIAMPTSMPPQAREPAPAPAPASPSSVHMTSEPAAVNIAPIVAADAASEAAGATVTGPISAADRPNANAPVQPVVPVTADGSVAASKNALVVTLHEDSWLEIKRSNPNNTGASSILISRLVKAGSTETFEIAEPVSVIIGNAAGVEMSLRGKPVDIKADTRTNVARLNLK